MLVGRTADCLMQRKWLLSWALEAGQGFAAKRRQTGTTECAGSQSQEQLLVSMMGRDAWAGLLMCDLRGQVGVHGGEAEGLEAGGGGGH